MQGSDSRETMVGQTLIFEVGPAVLGRVKFGSVAGEPFHPQAPTMPVKELGHGLRPMGASPVPQHQERPSQMFKQEPKKTQNLGIADGLVREESDQPSQAPPEGRNGDDGHRGNFLTVPAHVLEKRGDSPNAPGSTNHRQEEKAALVEEDQMGLTPASFFYTGPIALDPTANGSSSRS